jgi:hypothetical protein
VTPLLEARRKLEEKQRKLDQEWRELALSQRPKRHFNSRLCDWDRSAADWYAGIYVCEPRRLERAADRQFENGAPFFQGMKDEG